MDKATAAAAAAQHTAADSPEQPTAPAAPARPAPTTWQLVLPWAILGVWLAVDLGVVIYWACNQWGFLGALPLIIALAFHAFGLLVWITAFALLAELAWSLRLAYFLIGMAALGGMTSGIFNYSNQPELGLVVAAHIAGWSIPFLWLRRRGWRISATGRPPPSPMWQFTIGDMLVATTQTAAFLALTLASAANISRSELVIYSLLVVGSPAVVIIALSWRRFWRAVLVCNLLWVVLTMTPVWCFAPNFRWGEVGLLLSVVGASAISLLVASGYLRWAGYRLR